MREELLRKQSDLKEKEVRSKPTDEVRTILTEYIKYRNYLNFVYLKVPHPEFDRIMLCLCLCRILKTDIEFYRSNSNISEDQIFIWLSDERRQWMQWMQWQWMMPTNKTSALQQHPFWSLKVTAVSLADRSNSYQNTDNLIIDTDQGYIMVKNKTMATNILNADVDDIDLTDVNDETLFKVFQVFQVEVTDKLATLKKTGILSSPSLQEIKAISGILSSKYITELNHINLENLKLSCSADEDAVRSLLSICPGTTSVDNLKFLPDVRSRRLVITNHELSDSDTEELVTAMRDRVEAVEITDSVTLDTDSMARHLELIKRGSKCRALFVPDKYKYQIPIWRHILRYNENLIL